MDSLGRDLQGLASVHTQNHPTLPNLHH